MNGEFQNAYEVSVLTTPRRDEAEEAARLSQLGYWVLVTGAEICCRFTDAFIRWETRIVCASRTLAEIEEHYIDGEPGEMDEVIPPEQERAA
jgi:hypothetical protein